MVTVVHWQPRSVLMAEADQLAPKGGSHLALHSSQEQGEL